MEKEKTFNCEKCGKEISSHNQYCHDGVCNDCQKSRRFLKPGKNNKEERVNFIKFWADYIKTHPDEEWSEQQNIIINSQIYWNKDDKQET